MTAFSKGPERAGTSLNTDRGVTHHICRALWAMFLALFLDISLFRSLDTCSGPICARGGSFSQVACSF